MILLIDTSDYDATKVAVVTKKTQVHEFSSKDLSEKLVLEIKKFLSKNKINFQDLSKVEIRTGSHFSRTRTTVAVANAVIFGLNLPQKMFKPTYDREPNITLPKK